MRVGAVAIAVLSCLALTSLMMRPAVGQDQERFGDLRARVTELEKLSKEFEKELVSAGREIESLKQDNAALSDRVAKLEKGDPFDDLYDRSERAHKRLQRVERKLKMEVASKP